MADDSLWSNQHFKSISQDLQASLRPSTLLDHLYARGVIKQSCYCQLRKATVLEKEKSRRLMHEVFPSEGFVSNALRAKQFCQVLRVVKGQEQLEELLRPHVERCYGSVAPIPTAQAMTNEIKIFVLPQCIVYDVAAEELLRVVCKSSFGEAMKISFAKCDEHETSSVRDKKKAMVNDSLGVETAVAGGRNAEETEHNALPWPLIIGPDQSVLLTITGPGVGTSTFTSMKGKVLAVVSSQTGAAIDVGQSHVAVRECLSSSDNHCLEFFLEFSFMAFMDFLRLLLSPSREQGLATELVKCVSAGTTTGIDVTFGGLPPVAIFRHSSRVEVTSATKKG